MSINTTGHYLFNTDKVDRSSISVEEGRETLDFEIRKVQSYHYDPVAGEIEPIHNHFHLVRDTDGAMLECPSVGAQYVPVQHRDVFDHIVENIMPECPNSELEMVGTLHGLTTGLISMRFGDTFKIRGDKSPQCIRLFYSNPCNGSGRLVMGFTTVRVVCQNTLIAATRQASQLGWQVKHTKNAEVKVDGIMESIKNTAKAAIELKRKSEVLATIGVDSKFMREALEAVYPLNGIEEGSPAYKRLTELRDEVVFQYESGATAQSMNEKSAWTLFNSFSYPVFNKPRITRKTDKAEISYQGMTGDVGREVRRMFDVVYARATA